MREAIIKRFENSQYQITFKLYNAGQLISERASFGLWGVASGICFTMLRVWLNREQVNYNDPADAYFYDAYKITKATPNQLEYEGLDAGNNFIYKDLNTENSYKMQCLLFIEWFIF